jgi:hypothetical protein
MKHMTYLWLVVISLVGCQTYSVSTNDGRPMPPDPRPAIEVPEGAPVNAMAMFVGAKATDSNGNGYPDVINTEVFLFSQPYSSPMYEDGRFIFALYPVGDHIADDPPLIAAWHINVDAVRAARIENKMLKGYVFRLCLLDADILAPLVDRYPLMGANLQCRFEPSVGTDAVETNEVYWVQIGKRMTSNVGLRVPVTITE